MKLTLEEIKAIIKEELEEAYRDKFGRATKKHLSLKTISNDETGGSDMPVGKEIYLAPPEGAETLNDMRFYEIYAERQPNGGLKFYVNYGDKGKVYLQHKGSAGEFPKTYVSGPSDGRTFTDQSGKISLGTKGFSAGKIKG